MTLLFFWAATDSIKIIRSVLDDIIGLYEIVTNLEKSHVFLSGVNNELVISLHNLLGFRLGSLLIKYPGVPLISTRLTHINCMPLVEQILFRIKLWTLASLIYVWHPQLIKLVLFSIQV